MRNREIGDRIYNVRCDGYNPRDAIAIEPVPVNIELEVLQTHVSWPTLRRRAGPTSLYLAEAIMAHVPAAERDKIKFTTRPELITGFPSRGLTTAWHVDYAHGVFNVSRQRRVHNYLLVTANPGTQFLQESEVWFPNVCRREKTAEAIAQSAVTPFQIEPWTLVKFNATELHTAVRWSGAEPSPRLFFRATNDAIRAPA